MPMREIQAAFELSASHETVKIILQPLRKEWDEFQATTPAPAPRRAEQGTVSIWGAG